MEAKAQIKTIERLMKKHESIINWFNKKYNFDLSKASAKDQKEYNSMLAGWDKMKAKRDSLKMQII